MVQAGIIEGAINATSDKREQLKEQWIRGQWKSDGAGGK